MFEDKEFLEQFESAFDNFSVVELPVGTETVKIASMTEVPIKKTVELLSSHGEDKMFTMLNLLKLCLIDPADFQKIELLTHHEFTHLLGDWMSKSSSPMELDSEEDFGEH
jgi:hypothetical protein